ncbi:MAG: ester cyclase [Thermoleophilia bacterium]
MAINSEASDPATVARGYFEAVTRQDVEAMAAFWEPGAPDVIHGVVDMKVPGDLRTWFGNLFASFPDFHFEVLDVLTAGEKVAVRWQANGTFDGAVGFEGLMPNGSKVTLQGCDVLTVRDGLIRRNDAYMNAMDMARQLGALPAEGSAAEKAMYAALNLKTRLAGLLRRS